MDYTLRLADNDDLDDLCQIDYELFPENNFNERTLGIELSHGVCWVVHVDNALVGYALCRIVADKLVDVMRLGVREQFRKQGLGNRLLKAAMSLSGHTMLSVRKGNDPAIRLYQRHGFVITGSMPQNYAWVMEFKTTSSERRMSALVG